MQRFSMVWGAGAASILIALGGASTVAGDIAVEAEGAEPLPAVDAAADIRPGYMLVDDMVLPRSTVVDRMPYQTNLWSRHVVPYIFDANVNSQNRTRALDAMAAIEAEANIKFVARTTEGNYIRFRSSTGNNSYVGEVGDEQIVNIASWSWKYIIVHELLHALGCWHTQQRTDQSDFVIIRYDRMQSGVEGNFTPAWWTENFGLYDFDSVMHYDACSFSTCCPAGSTCDCPLECVTIEAKPEYADQQWLMGNRDHLSVGDIEWLVYAYGERDCNGNGVHDYYDIRNGTSQDCNANDMPDECDGALGVPSQIDYYYHWDQIPYTDCNGNGSPDQCDLDNGILQDCNGDTVPDACQAFFCTADINHSCDTDVSDFNILASNFGLSVPVGTLGDLTGDGQVSVSDFNVLAGNFGCSQYTP